MDSFYEEGLDSEFVLKKAVRAVFLNPILMGTIDYAYLKAEKNEKLFLGYNHRTPFSFLKKIAIDNACDENLTDVTLHIDFTVLDPNPALLKSVLLSAEDIPLACLQKQKTTEINGFTISFDEGYFYNLASEVQIRARFSLLAHGGSEVLAELTRTLVARPFTAALSTSFPYQLLSTFVVPKDEALNELKAEALDRYAAKSHSHEWNGYSARDPSDVVSQLQAIYDTLRAHPFRHIETGLAPFANAFLPYQSLPRGELSSLDMALVLLSLLYASGLNPLLGFVNSRFYLILPYDADSLSIGSSESFDEVLASLHDDEEGPAIIAIDDFFAPSPDASVPDFSALLLKGPQEFLSFAPAQFAFLVGIQPCLDNQGLYSLPTPVTIAGTAIVRYDTFVAPVVTENGQSKFDLWKSKLLDLNLKNSLVAMHLGGKTLQIPVKNSDAFVKAIKDYDTFTLVETPLSREIKDRYFLLSRHPDTAVLAAAKPDYRNKRLLLVSANNKTSDNLVLLARNSNTQSEENGSNPLRLSVGAIKWFENPKSAQSGKSPFYSPILLIPCTLPKRKSGGFYSLDTDYASSELNQTAFEYFKTTFHLDFSQLSSPFAPGSEDISLEGIFNAIRAQIQGMEGWEVIEDVATLSIFSFAHFVMWGDLDRYERDFKKNPIVASFAEGKKEWADTSGVYSPEELDVKLKPADLVVPLQADSSQLAAIAAGQTGESFILDGPPGTGKSQTIANMIATFMSAGKSVLFVAEKEVALSVVKNRLDAFTLTNGDKSLALGDFCLQVHSAKASRAEVLSAIANAWGKPHVKEPLDYAEKAEDLLHRRMLLNAVLSSLHAEKSFFLSVYEAILRLEEFPFYRERVETDKMAFGEDYVLALTSSSFASDEELLSKIASFSRAVGGYDGNAFRMYLSRRSDYEKTERMFSELDVFYRWLVSYASFISSFFADFFPGFPTTPENLQALLSFFEEVRRNSAFDEPSFGNQEYLAHKKEVAAYFDDAMAYATTRESLLEVFEESILSYSARDNLKKIRLELDGNFLVKAFGHAHAKKEFAPFLRYETERKHFDYPRYLGEIAKLFALRERLSKAPYATQIFPAEEAKSSAAIHADLLALLRSEELENKLLSSLTPGESKDFIAANRFFQEGHYRQEKDKAVRRYEEDTRKFFADCARYKSDYLVDYLYWAHEDDFLNKSNPLFKKTLDERMHYNDWMSLLNLLDEAQSKLPREFVLLYESGKIAENDLNPLFASCVYERIVLSGLKEQSLSSFNGAALGLDLANYRKALAYFRKLQIAEALHEITAKLPSFTGGGSSDGGHTPQALKALIANGGRKYKLRELFKDFHPLIKAICPCFMMSPLSVAQYLEPSLARRFDVVIFDEASQIPTSEAIGAIARGKEVIIAGDQQQMPPTNFFSGSSALYDNDDDPINDDLESLLDDGIALGLPRHRLNWHYRSRHESLIAFSNAQFYQNSLLTFPSPSAEKSHLSFRYVGGHYDKGTNEEEAKAIVEEIIHRLQDPEKRKHSIAVITFNEKQQNKIQDYLDSALADAPALEEGLPEPILVKNLENIQGDERDLILFSICFGPDEKGVVPLNFGPLSLRKGERRLNVAVSRAREEIVVFSSLYPEQIRSEEATNQGAGCLQSFLAYARNGKAALTNAADAAGYIPEPSLAEILQEELRKDGYDADVNVGVSSFRVDLAVKGENGLYCLGVLLDGHSYVHCPTCEDRNLIQPSVLSSLQWSLYRIWSLDYFLQREATMKKLEEAIESALKNLAETTAPGLTPEVHFVEEEAPISRPHFKPYPDLELREIPKEGTQAIPYLIERFAPADAARLFKDYCHAYECLGGFPVFTRGKFLAALRSYEISLYKDPQGFYWQSAERAKNYPFYRKRPGGWDIKDVPYEEILNAFEDYLFTCYNHTSSLKSLYKETLDVLGFQLLNETREQYLNSALHYAESKGNNRFQVNGEDILLLNPILPR